MIITDKFVFLHFPKTGGIFVTDVLKKLHARIKYKRLFINAPPCRELMTPNIKRIHGGDVLSQHGTYEQIPREHRNKTIISCIRNPFDRYVSTFEYRSWVRRHPDELEPIMAKLPNFPDLNFAQYVSFINEFDIKNRVHSDGLKLDVGTMTYAFIQFFFKDPGRIIANLNEAYLNSDAYQKDMAEVIFLRTEHLNQDLYQILLGFGYDQHDILFIIDEQKVNVTSRRKAEQDWQTYYNQDSYDLVKFKERFIFKLFPEYRNELDRFGDALMKKTRS